MSRSRAAQARGRRGAPPAEVNELLLAWGPPPARGRIRAVPEDFVSRSCLASRSTGLGRTCFSTSRSAGANSAGSPPPAGPRGAGRLARRGSERSQGSRRGDAAVLQPARVGPAPAGGWTGFEGEGFRVLEATPHGRKLRTGTHRANRFRIAIRDVSGNPEAITLRLRDIERGGVPNYFGPQRFGRDARTCGSRAWADGGSPPRTRGAKLRAVRGAEPALQRSPGPTRAGPQLGPAAAEMRRCWKGAEAGSA